MLTAIDDPDLRNSIQKEKLIDGFFNKPVQGDVLKTKIKEIMKIWPKK
jgi:hypothetical protein